MKNLATATLIALGCFLAACSSNVTPTTQEANAKAELNAPKDAVYTANTTRLSLEPSEEQKKQNAAIFLAVQKTADEAEVSKKAMPEWVRKQYAEFEEKPYTKERAAFQRSFGWGTGTYNGKPFYWFSHTNTDAWLLFSFSIQFDGKMVEDAKIRRDGYGHEWELHVENKMEPDEYGYILEGTKSWMGVTNSWTDDHCSRPDFNFCDTASVLDKAVADINEARLPITLVTKGHLPWTTKDELKQLVVVKN